MSNESVPESNPTSEASSTNSEPSEKPAIQIPVGYGMAEFTSAPAVESTTAENAAKAAVPSTPEAAPAEESVEPMEDFANILREFERGHARKQEGGGAKQIEGTVISVSAEQVFLDIGYKIEGVLPRSAFRNNAEGVKPGEKVPVSIKGRNEEGYYDLTRFKVAQPHDWTALEEAFKQKTAVVGTVTGVIKGGATVDVGVRAFMPASRSGTRDAAELEQLVGTEITCRITKLDVTDENVVVDRRVVLEEQARAAQEGKLAVLQAGDVLDGTVRSLMPYGAFIDLGGFDGLLHVSDISWNRVSKPEDVLSAGEKVRVRILKIDPETKKISLGLKQLEPEPWETAPSKYQVGQRVTGPVTRLADFGAFVELEPGVEGLIHISEMSWGKKVRHPSDVVKEGDRVDAVILAIKPEEKRISLGLKQTLTDPWSDVTQRFPVGSQVEGPVTKMMPFGAFVQIAEGVEGLVHVSEISAEKRIHHPQDVLRVGQVVKAQVLGIAPEKRQIKLSMKQLVPTSIDEYIAEHKAGDVVSGRVVDESASGASVELGENIFAMCRLSKAAQPEAASPLRSGKADLSSLSSMLSARWKGSAPAPSAGPEPLKAGQIRSFKITKLDADAKSIEVQVA
ncbi:30S ribosomal protein S1 [Occallatibacter savannae]|uniref:30S ribosomal protein S1 n=1 Tax=Occallatibacter savannae TaxID=1002691 RepID=UPI001EF3F838|nr:30S ribosomal protein S1 [Occallatibacter savannae]